jgi:hypothetical protein
MLSYVSLRRFTIVIIIVLNYDKVELRVLFLHLIQLWSLLLNIFVGWVSWWIRFHILRILVIIVLLLLLFSNYSLSFLISQRESLVLNLQVLLLFDKLLLIIELQPLWRWTEILAVSEIPKDSFFKIYCVLSAVEIEFGEKPLSPSYPVERSANHREFS